MTAKRHVPGISVYPRGRSWAYQVAGPPDVVTGRKPRLYRGGFVDVDAAWEAALVKRGEVDAGLVVQPSVRTVDQFFAEWLEEVRPAIKDSTWSNYRTNYSVYIRRAIGRRRLREVDVRVLNALYARLSRTGRIKADRNRAMFDYWSTRRDLHGGRGPTAAQVSTACGTTLSAAQAAVGRFRRGRVPVLVGRGLSTKSVKNIHRVLHVAFADAVAWGYLGYNPAEHARLPRQPCGSARRRAIRPWTVDELGRWLQVAMTDRFAGMWVLAATTGMRRSELAGAERRDLNLAKAVLTIDSTRVMVDGSVEDEVGKSGASVRTISLDPFTVSALTDHLALLDSERVQAERHNQGGKLFVWPDGIPVHPETITATFNRLVDQAGVRAIRLHDIRHTYATLALDEGVDPKVLSDRLGHASMNVTFQVYGHHSTGRDRPAAERVADVIHNAVDQQVSGEHHLVDGEM